MKRAALLWMVILICSPAAFGQWIDQQSNLQDGMCVFTLAPVSEEVVWASGLAYSNAATEHGSFCRTLDSGNIWSAAVAPIPVGTGICNITAVSADVAWIGVTTSATSETNDIYKTSDGGQTWTRQSNGLPEVKTFLDFVYFFDANDGLAVFDQDSSGYSPIFYSRDGGASWTRVADADNVPMLPNEFGLIGNYCVAGESFFWGSLGASTGRIFRTTDRGKSWSVLQTPFTASEYTVVSPSFKDSMTGLVVGFTGSGPKGIGVTHDGGATWLPAVMPELQFVSNVYIPGTEAGYMLAGEGSAFTLDGGATWTQIDDAMNYMPFFTSRTTGWSGVQGNPGIRKWQIGPSPAIGCYPLTGMDFGRLHTGLESAARSLSITNYGQDPLVISEIIPPGTAFKLHDIFPLPRTLQSLETARIKITFMPAAGEVMHDSVVFVNNAPLAPRHAVQLTGEGIVIDKAESDRLYAVTARSLYTIDPASGVGTKIADMTLNRANSLTLNPASGELLGISTTTTGTEIHAISVTNGQTVLLRSIPIGSMRALAFRADTLFGASLSGDFYRINLATGEAILASKAPGIKYYGLAVHPSTGELYASASGVTKDLIVKINPADGDTTLVGATGDNTLTPALAFSPTGVLYGFKGTATITIITIDLATGKGTTVGPTGVASVQGLAWSPKTVGVEQHTPAGEPVRTFALLQNYPNPFNAQTCVEVTAARPEQAEVMIYNLLGEPVAALHRGLLQAGKHKLIWTGNDAAGGQAPTGIYVIRLTAPGFTDSRKVLLLR